MSSQAQSSSPVKTRPAAGKSGHLIQSQPQPPAAKTAQGKDSNGAPLPLRSRKTVVRRLSTGQTISLTPQDDKMLRHAYDYMMGFVKRQQILTDIEKKKEGISHA
jgi:hypothetical protein